MSEENSTSSNKRSLTLFLILFLLSLAMNVFMFFKYVKRGAEIENQNKELTVLLNEANITVDSLQRELDFTIQQLQEKINENLAMQDLKESLRTDLENKIVQLQRAKNKISRLIANGGQNGTVNGSGGPMNLIQAKKEIEQLQTSNNEYLGKVEEAQKAYEAEKALVAESRGIAAEYKQDNDSLTAVNDVLEQQLGEASILRIANFTVEPIQEKRNKTVVTSKASKVSRLKMRFSVLGSDLVKKESKVIRIRVLGPNREVLSANNSTLADSDKLFSLEEEIDYDGSEKLMTFFFKPKEENYKTGIHRIEILENDVLLEKTTFVLY